MAPTVSPVATLFEIEKEAVAIDDPMRLLEMIVGVEQVYRTALLRNERLTRLADRWFSTMDRLNVFHQGVEKSENGMLPTLRA